MCQQHVEKHCVELCGSVISSRVINGVFLITALSLLSPCVCVRAVCDAEPAKPYSGQSSGG